ncbi:Chloroperoxidase [Stachybotrys elegans]|uniref:Chloroperoxidase n=1 Tax=Stachybotrys elegans TaxID=80388 RepID=A0A8K0SNM7_9HYPO|nr:Chloroperoxidase [Stachybotrys elegans]
MRAALLALLPLALAFPQRRSTIREWIAPGPSDSRGPCPGLNTLANHGYLPHDGRNINVDTIRAAVTEALNWDPRLATFIATQAINVNLGVESTDLAGLGAHNITEHDASLTRLDAAEGDPLRLNLDLLEALLADADGDSLTIQSLGRSRARVHARSGGNPLPGTMNSQANFEATALLATVPHDPEWAPEDYLELRAPKDLVRVWFTEERFPVELGWRTPRHVLTLEDLGRLPAAVEAAKPTL